MAVQTAVNLKNSSMGPIRRKLTAAELHSVVWTRPAPVMSSIITVGSVYTHPQKNTRTTWENGLVWLGSLLEK